MSGSDRLEERGEKWVDRQAGKFADHPYRHSFKWLLVVVGIAAIFGVVSWAGSWGGEAKRIASPTNVREQYTEIIGDWQGMEAAAGNVCDVRSAKPDPNSPTLVEDPTVAYRATYRRLRVDYNRRQANLFEGKLVGPGGYPRTAPTLEQKLSEVC